MTSIDPSGIRRILIRVNNWIGDVVMISPAVRALRAHYPGARIALLAKSWVIDTLRGDPVYDDLIEYDSAGRHRGVRGRVRLAAALRRQRFDLAVLFQKAFEAAALAFLAGARHRVGLATDRRSFLLTHALEPPPADTHHLEVFLGIARALGCPIEDPYPSFHLSQVDRELAATLLAEAGLSGHAPLLAFHPGASKEPRAWHPQRFAELGRRLAQTHGARLILFGSAAEHGLLRQIAGDLPSGRVLVPPPGLSIKTSGGILERCHLFVGNDSGPMHVAAALGVPTVGIFGPGTPRRTRPTTRGGRVVTVGGDYPCSPCRQDFFRECPPAPSGKPFCLEEVGVEEVERAAVLLLERPRQAVL
ncbi:MAG TPA: lipopolysaccharide heptosyltransferase II [Candidatus Dormibacteraeota bacterium]|nr:lipopolysaccharide heptosyltransferase II [Candidatus Dormibacteraeota bacterium]